MSNLVGMYFPIIGVHFQGNSKSRIAWWRVNVEGVLANVGRLLSAEPS